MMREDTYKRYVRAKERGNDIVPLLSLTFLFGITTFVADELLEETLGLEAAPVEVMVTWSRFLL